MKRFAYLDIEATHTNWRDAEIIEIAFIIKDENGKDLDHFQSLVRPKAGIEKEITELTGITTNMVNNAPEFFNLAPRISQKLEDTIIVAHKAEFDYEILKKALEKGKEATPAIHKIPPGYKKRIPPKTQEKKA